MSHPDFLALHACLSYEDHSRRMRLPPTAYHAASAPMGADVYQAAPHGAKAFLLARCCALGPVAPRWPALRGAWGKRLTLETTSDG